MTPLTTLRPRTVTLPTAPGVTVLNWPPGTGKSHATRVAIQHAFARGDLSRVVWAVHSTVSEMPLAVEAEDHFKQLGVACTIVKGKQHVTKPEYAQQLLWSNQTEVKIISFAHLHHVFEGHVLLRQLQPDLLVIDESPYGALVEEIELSLTPAFVRTSIGGRIKEISERLPNPTYSPVTSLRPVERNFWLTGRDFLSAVDNHWTQVDWDEFLEQVKKQKRQQVGYVSEAWLQAFQDDLAHPGHGSERFGLTWQQKKGGQPTKFRFYGSILRELNGLPPTLVLDAYAEQTLYDAMFKPNQVSKIVPSGGVKLKIQLAPFLHLDDLNLKKPTQSPRHLKVAEELALRHQQGEITIIAKKKQLDLGGSFDEFLEEATRRLGTQTSPPFKRLHHYAGKGLNAYAGRDLFFLCAPYLPKSHRVQTLAALFPYPNELEARKRVHTQLQDAECLQLAHRARQGVRPRSDGTEPRIVFAFSPSQGIKEHIEEIRDYKPLLRFTPYSPNPRWRDAVRHLAGEMNTHLGGVFHAFYVVLGLVKSKMDAESLRLHTVVLKAALHGKALLPDSELGHWLQHGKLRRFHDVKCFRKKDAGPLTEELLDLGFDSAVPRRHARVQGVALYTQVWVQPDVNEKAVFDSVYP